MNLMMKRILGILLVLQATNALADSGELFHVTTSGTALGQAVSFDLCLNVNGKNNISCQTYSTSNATLAIKTTAANHTYHYAGIKINTPGFGYTGGQGTSASGATFLGTVSDTQSANGTVTDTAEVTLTSSLPSSNTLALSVKDTGTNAALTGNPRQITITNSSTTTTAHNVTFSAQNTAPASPTIASNATPNTACGDIAPLGTCVLTITPTGATPSATAYDLTPTPIILTIAGDNTNTLTPTANILTYGSFYEGGYVYSIDDTYADYAEGVSIGGKVATLIDQAEPYIGSGPQATSTIWSSNGAGFVSADVSYDIIPLIAENMTTNDNYTTALGTFNSTYSNVSTYPFPSSVSFATCLGATDGACNSGNILALYDATYSSINYITTHYSTGCDPNQGGTGGCVLSAGGTTISYYAAGLCTATISGHNDWYLPAICEMDSVNGSLVCTSTQSMISSLTALIGDPGATTPSTSCLNGVNCLAGYYWSSTEVSFNPQGGAWVEYFSTGGSYQSADGKYNQLGVRCSRALTP